MHVCVCICTFRRPLFLKRLLDELVQQETAGLFTYSVVVVDNDVKESARAVVDEFRGRAKVATVYDVEPRRGIALARNRAVANARGDFVAFIDDDEYPTGSWLLTLLETREKFDVAGVLGPVVPYFEQQPPEWIVKGKFWERPRHPTGLQLNWQQTRTGNVLLRTTLFEGPEPAFRPEFMTSEDQDFFRRMIAKGHVFVWCDEAVAHEVVPIGRCRRSYLLKRALFRGTGVPNPIRTFGPVAVLKSFVAVLAYTLLLPFALVVDHATFMRLSVRLFDHAGRILGLLGINPIRQAYVGE
jgi:succinoglycan biosynthesis protein ExoM